MVVTNDQLGSFSTEESTILTLRFAGVDTGKFYILSLESLSIVLCQNQNVDFLLIINVVY